MLYMETKPLSLLTKTKIQIFGDLVKEAVKSVHACGKDNEILDIYIHLPWHP